MKKFWVTGIMCALAVSMAGCGETGAANGGVSLGKEPIGQTQGSTAENAASENKEEAKAQENTQESSSGNAGESKQESSEGKSQENAQIDPFEDDLYDAFKKGNYKVKYRGTGDRTTCLDTKSTLKAGESYTIDEIISALEKSGEFKHSGEIEFSEIDCGEDGAKELLARVPFGDEFSLYMIIKQIDEELVMCFDQDGWSRSYVTVNADGTIESGGSSGATVHNADYAYVDHNGDYKFYYGVEETLTLSDSIYAYKTGTDYVEIPVDGLDVDHLGVRDYYFDADYEKRSHYYSYFVIDDSFEDVTKDSDYDDSNELKKRFTDAGIKTYTKAEMDQMVKDQAEKIGYKK